MLTYYLLHFSSCFHLVEWEDEITQILPKLPLIESNIWTVSENNFSHQSFSVVIGVNSWYRNPGKFGKLDWLHTKYEHLSNFYVLATNNGSYYSKTIREPVQK